MTRQINSQLEQLPRSKQWVRDVGFCLICGFVVAVVAWFADTNVSLDALNPRLDRLDYNLLAQALNAGQLNLLKEQPPPELARLADPYDPNLNATYVGPVNDLSYYKGKLFLYFGITPELVFWPYFTLTGHYLSDKDALAFFIGIGFAAIAAILWDMRRRYFPQIGELMAGVTAIIPGVALALTTSANVYETAIVCGFAFAMLALAATWAAIHDPGRCLLWLAMASLTYGLAIGSRPSLLFGSAILLLPVIKTWLHSRRVASRRSVAMFLAATLPIAFIGMGLMLYNFLRFDNPFEFGWHYQLNTSYDPTSARQFSLHYLWFNFRLYFLQWTNWSIHFPFLEHAPLPRMPSDYDLGSAFGGTGILIRYPVLLFIAFVPSILERKLMETTSALRWFAAACLLLFIAGATTLCLFFSSSNRYEWDFLPSLLLLALIGTYCAQRVALTFAGGRLIWFGWFLLMGYSVAVGFLENVETRAENHCFIGNYFASQGRFEKARAQYEEALALLPRSADPYAGLGDLLLKEGNVRGAIPDYQKALRINPDFVEVQNNLGYCYFQSGHFQDAVACFEKAVELRPRVVQYRIALGSAYAQEGLWGPAIGQFRTCIQLEATMAEAHNDLGYCFLQAGSVDDAVRQDRLAVKIEPGSDRFLDNLGNALCQKGLFDEAIITYKKALYSQPKDAGAFNNLGYCLLRKGRVDQAIAQFNKATQLNPSSVPFRVALGNALCQNGRFDDAIVEYQKALTIQPGSADIHERLGDALFQNGELGRAKVQYQKVISLRPSLAQAHNNLGYCLQQSGRDDEAIAQYQQAVQLQPGFAPAYNNLGNAYRDKRMAVQAVACYQRAIELAPQFMPAQLNLAWMFATWPNAEVRNGGKAIDLAKHLNNVTLEKDAKVLRVLAAAYAEAGRYAQAESTVKRALNLASLGSKSALTNILQTELSLYLAHSPCRSTGKP
ncbi:MAG: tetratricopeptide repeat protein [Limisphaerales bacterium]